jgi:hypothetical protein
VKNELRAIRASKNVPKSLLNGIAMIFFFKQDIV